MSNGSREYSDLKVAWHLGAIKSLRETGLAVPPHLQLIISDLCNEDCSFCLVSDTLIATPSGDKPVVAIRVGDTVLGEHGEEQIVTAISEHEVARSYQIDTTTGALQASSGHPILCDEGWRHIQDIRPGHIVVKSTGELMPVLTTSVIDAPVRVYNFTCEPDHIYQANGFIVHNCAYRMTGYTSNANFGILREDGTINNNPARFIPLPKALEILDDAVSMGVEAVEITGGGESTVHPHHAEIFRHALDLGLECALVTNGVRLSDTVRRMLPEFAWVRYSLDAGKPETYAAMRGVKPQWFDQVLKNARALADEIKAAKSQTVFGISFIVTKENYRETYEAAELAADVGAQYIRYGAIFTPELADYYTDEMLADAQGGIELAQANLQRPGGFRIINMLDQRVGDLVQGRPDYQFCGYQHLNMYIGGDLNVYRCCNTAYNDLGLTGSLKDQTFRQFMESEGRAKAYKEFNAQACKHCAFNDKNRILNYLVDKNPRHVNFA